MLMGMGMRMSKGKLVRKKGPVRICKIYKINRNLNLCLAKYIRRYWLALIRR